MSSGSCISAWIRRDTYERPLTIPRRPCLLAQEPARSLPPAGPHESELVGGRRRLCAVAHLELVQDGCDVAFGGSFSEVQSWTATVTRSMRPSPARRPAAAARAQRLRPADDLGQHQGVPRRDRDRPPVRSGVPKDQAWIETLFGPVKGEWPHLEQIRHDAELVAELDRVRTHYNQVRLSAAIGCVAPTTNTKAAVTRMGPAGAGQRDARRAHQLRAW